MSEAIELRDNSLVIGPPGPSEWQAIKDQAYTLARSGLVPKALRGRPDDIMVIALAGRELGVPPMAALSRIHVVDGKPTLAAELMVALLQRAGHELWVEGSEKEATASGRRKGSERTQSITWTLADAQKAGVEKKDNWRKYPAAMLRARAISALCRFAFADVLMGYTYVPEEMGADTDEEGFPIEAEVIKPESTDDWLEKLRYDYTDDAIIKATDAIRKRMGGAVEVTSIDQCLLAKTSGSRRAIEQELAANHPKRSGSAESESSYSVPQTAPPSDSAENDTGSNPAHSPGAMEPQTVADKPAVSPPETEEPGGDSPVPPRSSSWMRISDAVSHLKITRQRVEYMAAAVLGADTPDGLSYYLIADLSEEVLSEIARRLNLDQQEMATK